MRFTYLLLISFYFLLTGHPARIGNYVNMKFKPAWQNCSDDTKLKKSGGLPHGYCIRCAIRDGWAKAEVCMN